MYKAKELNFLVNQLGKCFDQSIDQVAKANGDGKSYCGKEYWFGDIGEDQGDGKGARHGSQVGKFAVFCTFLAFLAFYGVF